MSETASPDLDLWPAGDEPVYTGMIAEHLDPFVSSSRLKVKIHEAETWAPPAGCTCNYFPDRESRRADCPANHGDEEDTDDGQVDTEPALDPERPATGAGGQGAGDGAAPVPARRGRGNTPRRAPAPRNSGPIATP